MLIEQPYTASIDYQKKKKKSEVSKSIRFCLKHPQNSIFIFCNDANDCVEVAVLLVGHINGRKPILSIKLTPDSAQVIRQQLQAL